MNWRTALRRRSQQSGAQDAQPSVAPPEQATSDLEQPGDLPDPLLPDDPRRLIAEHRQAERAAMLDLVGRATERAREEVDDQSRLHSLPAALRAEYHRLCWEALNQAAVSELTPVQLDAAYEHHRFTQWQHRNAKRAASMTPQERWDSYRGEDLLHRYRSGLTPRTTDERAAYREWADLDANVLEEELAAREGASAFGYGADTEIDEPLPRQHAPRGPGQPQVPEPPARSSHYPHTWSK